MYNNFIFSTGVLKENYIFSPTKVLQELSLTSSGTGTSNTL
jgi:hypothetical protein